MSTSTTIRSVAVKDETTMSVMVELAIETNAIESRLDELLVLGNRKNRRQLMELAVLSSLRAIRVLEEEPFVVDPDRYLAELEERSDYNLAQVREELREDTVRLRLFLEAECRLLLDLGVSQRAVDRIRRDLAARALGDPEQVEDMRSALNELLATLDSELEHLDDDESHGRLLRRLVGVLEALGGALVVGADAAAGAAGAAASAGLTVAGAGISGAFGTETFTRGVRRALD
jgi:hypothetical protein